MPSLPLRLLLSSTSYPLFDEDWRGQFIAKMAEALAVRDDITLSLWVPPGNFPPNSQSALQGDDATWLKNLSEQGGIAHCLRTRKIRALPTIYSLLSRLRRAYQEAPVDLIHVNWLQNALPLWGTKTPALISVLGSDFGLLRLPGMRTALRHILKTRRAILAPNADWMVPHLTKQFGDLATIREIPFGVDASWFSIQRTPSHASPHHWLCVTRLTHKKLGDLFHWGAAYFGPHRRLHLFGPMQENIEIPAWVDYHGATHPRALREDWFPKATGLISLSRHDEGRPQVMLEAMAAGLPILASDLPAHRTLITHQHTGYLVQEERALEVGLIALEDPDHNQAIGEASRAWVARHIGTWSDCALRYVDAYRTLLK